jgi:hypothetical protein
MPEKEIQAKQKEDSGIQKEGGGGSTDACRTELEPAWYFDSVYTQTTLGYQLAGNPYSVATMQQASVNLYGNNGNITANKKYVRFRPIDEEQTQTLHESELNLFDYPLDRDVTEEGDYYTEPGMGVESYPWLYTVVDMAYQPPFGITYEVLQDIYVPDTDIWLENEALRITGNPVNDSCNGIATRIPTPCEIDPCAPGCPLENCGGGGGGNPTADIKRPAGRILVWDSNLSANVAVRRTRVVARRWFKIDAVYTNDLGQFRCTKRFNNRVNIFVKFLNGNIHVSRLMGNPVIRSLWPTKLGIGIYSGNLSNITYIFERGEDVRTRRYRHWWAAQLMNAHVEYNEMAADNSIGQLSFGRLRVALSSFSGIRGSGATPMNSHRIFAGIPTQDYIKYYFANPLSANAALNYNMLMNGVLFRYMDMGLGYNTFNLWESNRVKDLMYHEMTHAAHFAKVGELWWRDFVEAESFTLAENGFMGPNAPYGQGNDGTISDIISVGESWAEHVAQVFCDTRYSAVVSAKRKQDNWYSNDDPVTGLSSHLNAIEDFSPFRTNVVFWWIPEGIYYDLTDNRNDALAIPLRVFIDDQVNIYTNEQLFQSLDPDVKSMPQYRARLLQENNNAQAAQVNLLFNRYNY